MFMKKSFFKKFIAIIFVFVSALLQFGTVFAVKKSGGSGGNLLPRKQTVQRKSNFLIQEPKITTFSSPAKEFHLKNNVSKKEKIYSLKYDYSGDLAKNPNKYMSIRTEISYHIGKILLGVCYAEINFRFNSITKEAKCLSCSTYQICVNPKATLEIFARRENQTVDLGRGYANIEFSYGNSKLDESDYSFTCDPSGEISEILDDKK